MCRLIQSLRFWLEAICVPYCDAAHQQALNSAPVEVCEDVKRCVVSKLQDAVTTLLGSTVIGKQREREAHTPVVLLYWGSAKRRCILSSSRWKPLSHMYFPVPGGWQQFVLPMQFRQPLSKLNKIQIQRRKLYGWILARSSHLNCVSIHNIQNEWI